MSIIFHITPERDWALAQKTGEYRLSTRGVELEVQGFIHCSDVHQVARIANAVYGDFEGGLVVLEIQVNRLDAEVRYENLDGGTELFPHIYGALPVTAVSAVVTLRKDSSGKWWFSRGGTEVTNPFVGSAVADRYADARPFLHGTAIDMLRRDRPSFGSAIDVACGTGLSTRALRAVSDHVVGVDVSAEMVRRAPRLSRRTSLSGRRRNCRSGMDPSSSPPLLRRSIGSRRPRRKSSDECSSRTDSC